MQLRGRCQNALEDQVAQQALNLSSIERRSVQTFLSLETRFAIGISICATIPVLPNIQKLRPEVFYQ